MITDISKKYISSDYYRFASDYEQILVEFYLENIDCIKESAEFNLSERDEYDFVELQFIKEVVEYITRRLTIYQKWIRHCIEIQKIDNLSGLIKLEAEEMIATRLKVFLSYKWLRFGEREELERLIYSKIAEQNEIDSILDYSKTKGTERIIYLEKLGLLDFLKTKEPFNASINALATALSGLIGVNATTVQSYINPIDNPTTDQKNNPLTKDSKVNIVINKLSDIGFKVSK